MISAEELRERIAPLFEDNFATRGELGAALSIWHKGEPLLELHGGFRDTRREQPWTSDTLVLVWSATKGIGSACLLHVLQENRIAIERRVAEFWPEFAQNGKGAITVAQMMSHSAGLCALDRAAEVHDYAAVIRAIEEQAPFWPPGSTHGYHARTFGFLIDELVRRIAGVSIGNYWRRVFADPLGIDLWIGLPNELNNRCATIYAAKAARPPSPPEFYRKLAEHGTLQQKTFTSPRGLHVISAMNKPEIRALPIVSFNGIGTASALAKFYGILANGGEVGDRCFFTPETLHSMSRALADDTDRIFEIPTAFSTGFMKNPAAGARIFGPATTAFGHPGAGGSNAFADPEHNLSFAYVMNQMEQTLLPNDKSVRLVDALYSAR